MKNVALFLIDNSAGYAFGENIKAKQIRVLNIAPDKLGDLAALAKKEGLLMTTQGGIAISELKAEKPAKKK